MNTAVRTTTYAWIILSAITIGSVVAGTRSYPRRRGRRQRTDHRGGDPVGIHQGTHDHSILHGSAHRTAVAQAIHRRVAHRAVGRNSSDLPTRRRVELTLTQDVRFLGTMAQPLGYAARVNTARAFRSRWRQYRFWTGAEITDYDPIDPANISAARRRIPGAACRGAGSLQPQAGALDFEPAARCPGGGPRRRHDVQRRRSHTTKDGGTAPGDDGRQKPQ